MLLYFNWIRESCFRPGHLKCTIICIFPLGRNFYCALANQSLGVALVPNKLDGGVVILFHFKDMENTLHRISTAFSFLQNTHSHHPFSPPCVPFRASAPSQRLALWLDPGTHGRASGMGRHILEMNVPVFFPPHLSLTINLFWDALLY